MRVISFLLRFIGAVVLAVIASIAIRKLALIMFGGTAYVISEFSFRNVALYMMGLSIGSTILCFLVPLLMGGLVYTVQGSKFIAIVVMIVFINYFVGECIYLLGDAHLGPYSDMALAMVKNAADGFYQPGAIITLIIEFFCFGILSVFLFFVPNE